MVTATLARRGTPWASKRSRSMLALSIMPWTRKLPHLKITRGGASWPARLPLGRTKRSTILVLSSTLTPWSVAPSSAVSNTRSKLTCISPLPRLGAGLLAAGGLVGDLHAQAGGVELHVHQGARHLGGVVAGGDLAELGLGQRRHLGSPLLGNDPPGRCRSGCGAAAT